MKGGVLIGTQDIVASYASAATASTRSAGDHPDWLATGLALRSAGCCSTPSVIR